MLSENDPALDQSANETAPAVRHGGLAQAAFRSLQKTFVARNHHPSGPHLDALMDILKTMEGMAEGTATQNVFLASLDPGCGKSSCAVEFSKALVTSAEHRNVGMLICVGRLDEAKALMQDLTAAGIGGRCAVKSSDEDVNSLSGCPAPDAQVLIVTQQKVELETRRRSFKAVSLFQHQGSPRAVRVWDESWLPGAPISLDRTLIGGIFSAAQGLNRAFARALEDLFCELRGKADGELVTVPDWTGLYAVTELDVLAALERERGSTADRLRLTTSALFFVAGRQIRVRRERYSEGGDGRVIISYQDTLPDDIAPLVVLDASIRVRQTYADAVAYRGVVLLKQAVKDYANLTVHLWKAAGSKTAFRDNGPVLVAGMAATIMERPSERWLLVTHKPSRKTGDVQAQLRKALPPGVSANVSVICWGRHMATNEYREVGNVILGGTLFMPTCHYLALTHLAKGRPAELLGFASTDEVLKTTHGEHRNLVLQAACRGRVRQSQGTGCLPMNLYIIAAAASAIPTTENVHTMFPGAQIKRWCPVPPRLTGKALDASVVLEKLLDNGALSSGAAFLSYGQIAAAMPGKDGGVRPMAVKNFKSRIADTDPWRDHVTGLGLIEAVQGHGQRTPTKGLRLAEIGELPDWQDAA